MIMNVNTGCLKKFKHGSPRLFPDFLLVFPDFPSKFVYIFRSTYPFEIQNVWDLPKFWYFSKICCSQKISLTFSRLLSKFSDFLRQNRIPKFPLFGRHPKSIHRALVKHPLE